MTAPQRLEAADRARLSAAWIGSRGLALARQPRVQRSAGLAALVAASVAVAGLIVQHLDELRLAPWRLEPVSLIAGLALQAAAIGIDALIWADISHRLGSTWNPRRDLRVYAYSLLARRLPGAVWHVIGRATYYADAGLGRRVGVVGSAVEAGLLVVTGLGLALAFFPELRPVGGLIALALLALGPQLLGPALRLLVPGRLPWLPPPPRLYLWIGLYLVAWLVTAAGAFLIFDALYPLDPSLLPHVIWASTFSTVGAALIVVLPGGLGLRELGLTALMSEVMPAGVAAALAVALRIATASIELLWASIVIAVIRPGAEAPGAESASR